MNVLTAIGSIMNCLRSNYPLVVIIGVTGCGKTKLSLKIAQKYQAEIISADSMQIYKGLNVLTNKATREERLNVPHHLIDFLDPFDFFTVTDFNNKALPIIDNLLKNGKMPILVGGTMYYIESILYNVLINPSDISETVYKKYFETMKKFEGKIINDENFESEILHKEPIVPHILDNVSNNTLYEILKKIDPISSLNIHVNERRKVIRRLQVYQQYSRTYSDIITEQKKNSGNIYGGPLRYNNAIVLWIDCDLNVLKERIFKRTDEMIQHGLIEELLDFHKKYNAIRLKSSSEKRAYTEGVFQSIGLKQFHKYLLMSKDERNTKLGRKEYWNSIIQLKLDTFNYAKKQIKWINKRFLQEGRQIPLFFRLDSSNPECWDKEVMEKAFEVLNCYIDNQVCDIKPLQRLPRLASDNINRYCSICEMQIVGSNSWENHLKSKKHRYNWKQSIAILPTIN